MASLFLRALALVPLIGLFSILEASPLRVIAVTGQLAPDGNGVFSTFETPTIGGNGHIAFRATMESTAGGFRDDSGVFLYDPNGAVTLVAREGTPSPVTDAVYGDLQLRSTISNPVVNKRGQLAFQAPLSTGTAGIFLHENSSGTTPIVIGGTTAPAEINGTQSEFVVTRDSHFALNDHGQVALTVGLTGGFFPAEGIFLRDNNEPIELVAASTQLTPSGLRRFEAFGAPALNEEGQVAFGSRLNGGVVGGYYSYTSSTAGLSTIAESGQLTDDAQGEFLGFNTTREPFLNSSGEIAFRQFIRNVSDESFRNRVIYLGDSPGNLTTIAESDQPTPDGTSILTYFDQSVSLNDAGQIALSADLDGKRFNSGIFFHDGFELSQIVIPGNSAPDANGIVSTTFRPLINNHAQVVFAAAFSETERGLEDDFAVIFADSDRQMYQILREGDQLLGSTVTDLAVHTIAEARSLNDAGQVAFRFALADGREGIAVWSIPEPATLLLAVFCLFAGVAQQRRR